MIVTVDSPWCGAYSYWPRHWGKSCLAEVGWNRCLSYIEVMEIINEGRDEMKLSEHLREIACVLNSGYNQDILRKAADRLDELEGDGLERLVEELENNARRDRALYTSGLDHYDERIEKLEKEHSALSSANQQTLDALLLRLEKLENPSRTFTPWRGANDDRILDSLCEVEALLKEFIDNCIKYE